MQHIIFLLEVQQHTTGNVHPRNFETAYNADGGTITRWSKSGDGKKLQKVFSVEEPTKVTRPRKAIIGIWSHPLSAIFKRLSSPEW